jgi:ABC-2 type transport system ATP-binding protein
VADDIAIKADHVGKTFKLPHEKQSSIKGALINIARGGKRTYEKQEVLKDVSFEIKKGEFFGIVGRNGSGKSTLLKIISGIYTPTTGSVHVNGKLIPFIELGVGFNHELTGRENVFLNGALLGFSRNEMETMYDEIVEFAELERFMDQKLKNYSSGMQVRLAFSIAIRAKSDVLVLDEVLAVGDESFQRKCVDVFERYKAEKRTVILVTHDMSNVTRFCTRALLLNKSELVDIGSPAKIADAYTRLNQEETDRQTASSNDALPENHLHATITNTTGGRSTSFKSGDTMRINFSWDNALRLQNIGAAIMKESGEFLFGVNTLKNKDMRAVIQDKGHEFGLELELNLGPGRYYIMYGAFGADRSKSIEFIDRGPGFVITVAPSQTWEGIVHMDSRWLPVGTIKKVSATKIS